IHQEQYDQICKMIKQNQGSSVTDSANVTDNNKVMLVNKKSPPLWIVDAGATNHMCHTPPWG
ncbi:hypothetical protein HAX54_031160, partial [Datura stramonium]|nr:hypothetical protein [Datura stramonium]